MKRRSSLKKTAVPKFNSKLEQQTRCILTHQYQALPNPKTKKSFLQRCKEAQRCNLLVPGGLLQKRTGEGDMGIWMEGDKGHCDIRPELTKKQFRMVNRLPRKLAVLEA